jgi:hypothetical protein
MQFTDYMLYGFNECMKRWIREHLEEIAKLMTCIFSFPSAVLVFLGFLGFGLLGPVAGELFTPTFLRNYVIQHMTNMIGSFAAWTQSIFGPIVAKSLFAILQSAAMGGYGLVYVKVVAFCNSQVCGAAIASLLEAMRECNDSSGCTGFQSTVGHNTC